MKELIKKYTENLELTVKELKRQLERSGHEDNKSLQIKLSIQIETTERITRDLKTFIELKELDENKKKLELLRKLPNNLIDLLASKVNRPDLFFSGKDEELVKLLKLEEIQKLYDAYKHPDN